ncbi:site-specific integrase [Granulicella arctica]|uniref:Integrase n=1 Tax=Granulicella arctica TaxID=940613 RepID=A0A7Y9TI36_9BACT|nr:site-specific integrase [Granulicella arctica]NYF80575.1 integrase [Granulicella arctica]
MKLAPRRDPYWHLIAEGQHLGYRRTEMGGTWIARQYTRDHGRRFQALGAADDTITADGAGVQSFAQAVEAAQTWFRRLVTDESGEVAGGPYTVAQAMAEYIADRERTKRKSQGRARLIVDGHIVPALGKIDLSKLTQSKLKDWRDKLATNAPRVRTGFVMEKRMVRTLRNGVYKDRMKERATNVPLPQASRPIDTSDPEALRKRQATANRILTVLKAALNFAHEQGHIASKAAWENVKPFRKVDVPKIRFLTADEVQALIPACEPSFSVLVKAALLTGCRFGELTGLKVGAFDPVQGTIFIAESKNGESRHVDLTDEGIALFSDVTANRDSKETIFLRANGKIWKSSEQKRPMDAACEAAKIEGVTFHILRHTWASLSVMNGMPIAVVAENLGHKDTRITERHYAHLSKSFKRASIRANAPSYGFGASA